MDLSWERIVVIAGACAAAVKFSVPAFQWFADQIQARRKNRREVESERGDAAWTRMGEMLAASQKDVERLQQDLDKIRLNPSFSSATITHLYKKFREIGASISRLEKQIINEAPHSELMTGCDDLRKRYDELGEKLP